MRIFVIGVKSEPETFLKSLFTGLVSHGHEVILTGKRPSVKNCDVIYFPWNSSAVENPGLFSSGIPCVVSCRGSQINVAPHNPERSKFREGLTTVFQKASAVHCVSLAIQKEAEQYGLEPKKSSVIYSGVDTEFFSPETSLEKGKNVVISVGNLNWVKGFEYALMAVKKLSDAGLSVDYRIIGDGPDKQRLLFTIEDLGLGKNVRLLGKMKASAVRNELRSADVCLLPSLSEGISNAALEAMASGVPVVTTDCGGMREAVDDGREGFVVPLRDVAIMAEKIKFLFLDPSQKERMGAAAREKILKQFQLEKQMEQFNGLFNSLCQK